MAASDLAVNPPAAVRHDDFFSGTLASADPDIHDAIRREVERLQNSIELIASENIVSRAVLEAQGSVMTNKYAEGYPGRRYYGGCAFVDKTERLAIARAKNLFSCAFANVQAHSGSQANQAGWATVSLSGPSMIVRKSYGPMRAYCVNTLQPSFSISSFTAVNRSGFLCNVSRPSGVSELSRT